ncbi:hypothetical protein KKH30_04635 [Candidatus Micrarchaeota archaeon]|nr:hypothetical protein [Candidatus Micrarchaeota archaeon]MBU1940026.1 hypothetical protein [Candidatus Micrarchaeota archaeon]
MAGVKKQKGLLARFDSFARGISEKDKVCIVFHPDADGLCAAVIASNAIKQLRGRKAEWVFFQPRADISISAETVRTLKRGKFTKLIVVDLSTDQNPAELKKASRFLDVLVIDHHKIYNDMNSARIVFIKPQLIGKGDDASYPASKLSFDLFSRVCNLDALRWIASVGIMGDNAVKRWAGFLCTVPKRNKISLKKLHCLEELISAVESLRQNMLIDLFYELCTIERPADLCNSKFFALKAELDTEVARIEKEFARGREQFPELGLEYFIFKSKYNVKSSLINKLSNANPHITFVIVQKHSNGIAAISARRQDGRVRVNDLLERAVKGMKGASAGGHAPAAAGRLKTSDLEKFKKRLVSIHPMKKKSS